MNKTILKMCIKNGKKLSIMHLNTAQIAGFFLCIYNIVDNNL